jgi:DNA polymerase-3 subunit epsilon
MSMYLFFDTETTGLPKKWQIPPERDPDNWPRIVQIAWAVYDESGTEQFCRDFIIRPDGFEIPAEAARVHGISTARALDEGRPILPVLADFARDTGQTSQLVAHNADFDIPVITAECIRYGIAANLRDISTVCTMKSKDVVDHCRIPNPWRSGYKWPKLEELHHVLFGEAFPDAHDAAADVRACSRCFFALKDRGIL